MPSTRGLLPRLVILFSLLLFAWTHRHALALPGFAEDMGLVQDLTSAAASGSWLSEVVSRWTGPLWGPGSTMWRPWAFLSVALDARWYDGNTGLSHITNLSLHVAAATFAALLVRLWLRSLCAAVAAFATMLLHPWTAEITMWLVGRFDGWATAGVLASLYAAARSAGRIDRWFALSLLAATVAYTSKESALILPPMLFLMMLTSKAAAAQGDFAHAQPTEQLGLNARLIAYVREIHWPLLLSHLGLCVGYMLCRRIAVGSLSTNVYSTAQVLDFPQLLDRVIQHIAAFASIGALAPVAAVSVSILAIAALVTVCAAGQWLRLLFATIWILIVFLGAALHFSGMVGAGDGYRLYYLALFGFALIVGVAVGVAEPRIDQRFLTALLLMWAASLALWQDAANRQWWVAAKEIRATEIAIARELPKLSHDDYALVMLPDPIGQVPAFRNAQGAIIRAAGALPNGFKGTDFMVAMLPLQLAEWHRLMQIDVIPMISKRPGAPPRPTRYYCKELGQQTLQPLGFWPAGTLTVWNETWRARTLAACPSLKL